MFPSACNRLYYLQSLITGINGIKNILLNPHPHCLKDSSRGFQPITHHPLNNGGNRINLQKPQNLQNTKLNEVNYYKILIGWRGGWQRPPLNIFPHDLQMCLEIIYINSNDKLLVRNENENKGLCLKYIRPCQLLIVEPLIILLLVFIVTKLSLIAY